MACLWADLHTVRDTESGIAAIEREQITKNQDHWMLKATFCISHPMFIGLLLMSTCKGNQK